MTFKEWWEQKGKNELFNYGPLALAAWNAMQERIVDFIRDRAIEMTGKTWYYVENELNNLAQEIEDMK